MNPSERQRNITLIKNNLDDISVSNPGLLIEFDEVALINTNHGVAGGFPTVVAAKAAIDAVIMNAGMTHVYGQGGNSSCLWIGTMQQYNLATHAVRNGIMMWTRRVLGTPDIGVAYTITPRETNVNLDHNPNVNLDHDPNFNLDHDPNVFNSD